MLFSKLLELMKRVLTLNLSVNWNGKMFYDVIWRLLLRRNSFFIGPLRFYEFEQSILAVYENMQTYYDCISSMSAAGVALSNAILAFYTNSTLRSNVEDTVRSFVKIHEDINKSLMASIHT